MSPRPDCTRIPYVWNHSGPTALTYDAREDSGSDRPGGLAMSQSTPPASGVIIDKLASATPGRALTESRMRETSSKRAPVGGALLAASMPTKRSDRASKPSGCAVSDAKVRTKSPAPTISIRLNATCTATSTPPSQPRFVTVRAEAINASRASSPVAREAGATPNTVTATTAVATVNASTRQSRPTSSDGVRVI